MKRSEMIEYIRDDLEEILSECKHVRPTRYEHWIKYKAEGILSMLEGFDMLPPHNKLSQDMIGYPHKVIGACIWEPENEEK